ncbi:MAG: hypothetical protein ACREME_05305, partial [Gemmatimonadales bacterium]
MTRRHWAIGILAAWVLSLGWLVKREVFRSTGARLAEAALAVSPGALYYRLDLGGTQVGFVSTTIDTLPDSIRVNDMYVLDVPVLGELHRTTARSVAMLTRALRLQRLDVTFDGDVGRFDAHGSVLGDTILQVAIVSDGDSQVTRVRLTGPVTIPSLLPLRLAFGGELEEGRSYSARLFDPLLLAGRDLTVRVAAESTLVVADSAALDSTTMVWLPEHFDTVRAFRIEHTVHGVPVGSWIDGEGRLVRSANAAGFGMERSAFEIAYENFRRRDTARALSATARPRAGDVVASTAARAGIRLPVGDGAGERRFRLSGVDRSGIEWVTGRQRLVGDTVVVRREPDSALRAAYRLPAVDSTLARWLAA